MKKTVSASIGGRVFQLEDDAYEALRAYLESLRVYFAGQEGRDEIPADIEARIAERLAEVEPAYRTAAVPRGVVEEIVDSIGRPEELDDGLGVEADLATGERKLFRDTRDGILGGVCEGLGAYFGVGSNWVRLVFVLAAFVYGLSILFYLLLWVLVPAARTAGDRLAMRGVPVTLSSVAGIASAGGGTVPVRSRAGAVVRRFFQLPGRIMGAAAERTRDLIAGGSPSLRRGIGITLVLLGGLAVLLVFLAVGVSAVGFPETYFDETYSRIVRALSSRVLVLSVAVAVLIPAALIVLSGLSMIQNRSLLPPAIGFGMVGVWFFAAVVGGVRGVQAMMEWQAFEATSPLYERVTQTLTPGEFERLTLPRSVASIQVVEGDSTTIRLEGRWKDLASLKYRTEGGEFVIDREEGSCVMCDLRPVRITVATPHPDSIDFPWFATRVWEMERRRAQREAEEAARQSERRRLEALRKQVELQALTEQLAADSALN